MIVVSDTGPLNYLVQMSRIELLVQLYETVIVPRAVLEELNDRGASAAVREWAINPPAWIRVQMPANVVESIRTDGRGKGEREAIALAIELKLPILSDDRQARHVARGEGLEVSGTLGVLRVAHALGLDDIDQALAALASTNFYLSKGLLDTTREEAYQMRADRGKE